MRKVYPRLGGFFQVGCCALLLAVALSAAPSNVAVLPLVSPVTAGQPVQLIAAVTPGATGHVTFYDGSSVLAIAAVSGGQAKFKTSLLAAGVHSLTAHYSGDAAFLPADTVVAVPLTVAASPSNSFQPVAAPASGSNSPVAGDFNGDGKADFAMIDVHGVSVMLGNGDGSFQTPVSYGFGPFVASIAVGDFNGDGVADLAVSSPSGVSVLAGRGDGSFVTPSVLASTLFVGFLTVADFNGDGKADLAGSRGYVMLGNGDLSFQTPLSIFTGVDGAIVAADVNGDGKTDLIAATGSNLSVMLGNGDGSFRTTPVILANAFSATDDLRGAIAAGDFNGDGRTDLAVVIDSTSNCGCAGVLAILIGKGDGTFQLPSKNSTAGLYLTIGDFNGDGRQDVLVSGLTGSTGGVELWRGNGDGTLQVPAVFNSGLHPHVMTAADINADGRMDLLTADGFNLLGAASPDLTIAVTHTGTFAAGTTGETYRITVTNSQYAATTGQVAVTDTLPQGVTASSIGGSGWTCILPSLVCSRADSLAPNASYPPITIAVTVAVNVPGTITNTATVSGGGDFNLVNNTATDTVLGRAASVQLFAIPNPATLGQVVDLVATVSDGGSGKVAFYDGAAFLGSSTIVVGQASFFTRTLGAGIHFLHAIYIPDASSVFATASSGNFAETVNAVPSTGFLPTVNYPGVSGSFIVAGDFNGDGKGDLAVGGAGGQNIAILLGNGDGTYGSPQMTPLGAQFQSVTAADLNGDGKADLVGTVVSGTAAPAVTVFLSNGDGTFQTPQVLGVGHHPVVADFNNDGKPDVAFASGTVSVDLSLFPGKGDGTFAAPLSFHLSDTAVGMVAGDFNRDGNADLAIAFASTGVSVLPGTGRASFQPPVTSSIVGTGALLVADFNGDGQADLAVGTAGAGTVLLGRGDGTLQATGTAFTGTPLAAADWNGDGKLDLVVLVTPTTIQTIAGNGDGSFQGPVTVSSSANYAWSGDVNLDGRVDLLLGAIDHLAVLFGSASASPTRINLTVWRPDSGNWIVNPSNSAPFTQQWGFPGDIPLAGDFDRDGQLDYIVWRPSSGTWYILPTKTPTAPVVQQWGLPGDVPAPANFDGDGVLDFAVWRPSNGTWYILPSASPATPVVKQWGLPGDVPVVGDFDGDGKADFAVWRPSEGNWYITLSSNGATLVKQWGLSGDIPVAADYDGDGKTDFAVWRPSEGNWYITPSRSGTPYIVHLGQTGDIPVPRDYDQDSKADPAVWRPSTGIWSILPSASPSAPLAVQWGLPNDVPIYRPVGN